ncbi:MAG TPA: SUMF1/EgtB/PvdO family nonheme iron enzyme, partial [Chloroflexota bacterium]
YWLLAAALVAACSLQTVATPPPTQAPPVQPTHTLIPVPTEVGPTATLVPVALAGPRMEVGSMWPYVDGSILVAVPGGPFTMGHGGSDNPEHTVTLSDFWIYQAKVTNQEYALCVKAGKCKAPDPIDDFTFNDVTHANDPVVGVTYAQSSDYCTFVHGRLPTEAEWEKAARGPDGNIYPWGSNAPVCDFLNFNNCVGKITNVTTYEKGQSFYHALDMEGNVFEWVADWYSALYYKSSASQDPLGPDTGQQRSVRSSSYRSNADQVAASTRFFDGPKDHRRDLGFRCVVNDPTYFAPICQTIGLLGSVASGTSSGGTLTATCPKVSIGLTAVCQQGKVTVVVVDSDSPDPNASVSGVGSCTPVSVTSHTFPQIYDCTSDTTVTVSSTCSYTASSPATCSAHYQLDKSSGMCVWDGTGALGGQCLPGLTFDPVNQCCSAEPGTPVDYPVCPLGSALGSVGGKSVCVPNGSALNNPSHTEYVHVQDPATCTGGGNPGTACTLNANSCGQSCRYGGVFSPSTCSCICYPG